MAGEEKKEKQRDKTHCQYKGCYRSPRDKSKYCIFHIPGEEKENSNLWYLCMEQFYELVKKGEGNFKGFVLKDVDISGRVFEQEVDFTDAEFSGCNIFSITTKETEFKKKCEFFQCEVHWSIFFC